MAFGEEKSCHEIVMKASNNLACARARSLSPEATPTSNDTETVAAHAQNSCSLSPCEESPVASFQAEQPTTDHTSDRSFVGSFRSRAAGEIASPSITFLAQKRRVGMARAGKCRSLGHAYKEEGEAKGPAKLSGSPKLACLLRRRHANVPGLQEWQTPMVHRGRVKGGG